MGTKKNFESFEKRNYILPAWGLLIGVLSGFMVSFFRFVLAGGESIREYIVRLSSESTMWLLVGVAIFISAYVVAVMCTKAVPLSGGSGIPQVKGELSGQLEQNWWKIIIAKFIGGFAAISAGLSLGREGPSVQLGAMVGKGVAEAGGRTESEEKILMTCGAAAGLAGAFCAPLAGTVFALEELHKNFSTTVLVSAMASSIASDFVAKNIFGLEPVFSLPIAETLPLTHYWQVVLLGVALGIFGVLYNKCTVFAQNLLAKIKVKTRFSDLSLWVRIAIPFICALFFIAVFPYVLSGGGGLVAAIGAGKYSAMFLLLLLTVKFVFSMISFGCGVPGGIFLPLLVMGSIFGGLYTEFLSMFGENDTYLVNFVILGMVGCFTAIVRSPVTGVLLLTEMTGEFTNFMALAIVALCAFITADILGGEPIYDTLLDRLLVKNRESKSSLHEGEVSGHTRAHRRKVLVESEVYIGSLMDGGKVEKMLLPKGCLIVSVDRNGKEFVPHGQTVLLGGDKLVFFCAEADVAAVESKLDKICKTLIN